MPARLQFPMVMAVSVLIVGCSFLERPEAARYQAAKADVRALANALEMFKSDSGEYPDSLSELVVSRKATNEPYITKVPQDPWGQPYHYQRRSLSEYSLASFSRDGIPGGEGYDADITAKDA